MLPPLQLRAWLEAARRWWHIPAPADDYNPDPDATVAALSQLAEQNPGLLDEAAAERIAELGRWCRAARQSSAGLNLGQTYVLSQRARGVAQCAGIYARYTKAAGVSRALAGMERDVLALETKLLLRSTIRDDIKCPAPANDAEGAGAAVAGAGAGAEEMS